MHSAICIILQFIISRRHATDPRYALWHHHNPAATGMHDPNAALDWRKSEVSQSENLPSAKTVFCAAVFMSFSLVVEGFLKPQLT
jgi:hypothetical protein